MQSSLKWDAGGGGDGACVVHGVGPGVMHHAIKLELGLPTTVGPGVKLELGLPATWFSGYQGRRGDGERHNPCE